MNITILIMRKRWKYLWCWKNRLKAQEKRQNVEVQGSTRFTEV